MFFNVASLSGLLTDLTWKNPAVEICVFRWLCD